MYMCISQNLGKQLMQVMQVIEPERKPEMMKYTQGTEPILLI